MNVADFLQKKKVAFSLIPHHQTYTAQRMAEDLHLSGHDVAKTVLLRSPSGPHVVAVLPASKSVDLKRAARAVEADSLELAAEAEIVEHCPDCEIGALPPFGSRYGMQTIVDKALTEEDELVFEGNTHHEAIRMHFDDYRRIENPLVASFTC